MTNKMNLEFSLDSQQARNKNKTQFRKTDKDRQIKSDKVTQKSPEPRLEASLLTLSQLYSKVTLQQKGNAISKLMPACVWLT